MKDRTFFELNYKTENDSYVNMNLSEVRLNPLMGKFLSRIKGMNEVMKVGFSEIPTDLGKERLIEFRRILLEEVSEVDDIIENYEYSKSTMKDLLDWLGDIVVYVCSESGRWGLPIDEGLNAIMNSQYSKLDENGQPIHKDGKFIKGPNYIPPDEELGKILNRFFEDENIYLARLKAEDDGVFPKGDVE